ncbi:FTR1 family iron permease [Microbacterium sp. STN6]|uniref:iron uptake transporter permease EfeU n=1 Tax=Microbacterium sp. STN6 TaxID=2995588 RepID=UPI002260996B|nr:iron uptake transporter permease EfeU [Microbacterium sp. STN6]MCX7521914.1 FTR1 family iron permease [Microbacterium sp. STN6]
MLATFVIGLREGLEAALIVGIIAAFLRRNGASLRPMWLGVGTAVLLSVGVGVTLQAVAASLPQSQQEGMETIIGLVAVVFVTGMIAWMKTHARGMKRELEREAAAALGSGAHWALAGMAFLAVLKEGFETSVFLLATFQASTSTAAAAFGAVIGILSAVVVGIGLYTGGVKLNLGRFFNATGVFLVFVAAGLVLSATRTAHEAGWVTIGQQHTLDLTWLAPHGSVQAALVTGVLGMPADPRVIELLAWLLYLVPVLAYSLWPARAARPHPVRAPLLGAAALAVAAAALVLAVPTASPAHVPESAPVTGGGTVTFRTGTFSAGTFTANERTDAAARLTLSGSAARALTVDFTAADRSATTRTGADARWSRTITDSPADRPRTLTLDQLVALNGGRLPVGIDAARNPGPFHAEWTRTIAVTAWSADGGLLDARAVSRTVATVSGGGLGAARSLGVTDDAGWHAASARVSAVTASITATASAARELLLWRLWLPLTLLAAALVLAVHATRHARQSRRASEPHGPIVPPTPAAIPVPRSTRYAHE